MVVTISEKKKKVKHFNKKITFSTDIEGTLLKLNVYI